MRIVLDAMGSDNHPVPDVAGAILAARRWGDTIVLVGDETRLKTELANHDTEGLHLEVVHASQLIEMTDKPSEIVKSKPDSSMHVGLGLVQNGEADAFVTAGNTGGALAIAMLSTLRRIKGVKRPALTAIFPHLNGKVVAADIGANADCRPEYLEQFALMASLHAERAMGIQAPRVALLSNGEEEGKGNALVHETGPLLAARSDLNYVGNVEPKEALSGETDIVIHDGFVGNIFIKSVEAAASMMGKLLKQNITAGALTSVGGLLAKPAFDRVSRHVDPFEIGGAPLLGLNGVVIVGHGRSNDIAIMNAIRQAREAVMGDVTSAIKERLG